MTQLTESQRHLLTAARSLLGVPWRHRGRSRTGLDCGGLPWLMYAECGVILPDRRDYGREPFKEGLQRAMVEALGAPVWEGAKGSARRTLLQPADVVLMDPAGLPRHVGVIGDDDLHTLSLIHAASIAPDKGPARVVELGLSDMYLKQIVCVFRRPVA